MTTRLFLSAAIPFCILTFASGPRIAKADSTINLNSGDEITINPGQRTTVTCNGGGGSTYPRACENHAGTRDCGIWVEDAPMQKVCVRYINSQGYWAYKSSRECRQFNGCGELASQWTESDYISRNTGSSTEVCFL